MAESAYVFVYLPELVQPTVAGRFDWDPAVDPHVGSFVYAESYLGNKAALALDPIALPLRAQLFRATLSSGFFGVIRDAIPDDWGRHVAAKLRGNTFQRDFDYLWLNTADRTGALAFGKTPQAPIDEKPVLEWARLHETKLLDAIQKVDRDINLTAAEEAVVAFGAGTTAGGARPKLTVIRGDAIWLAKLNRHSDRFNVVRVEAAMLDLAVACGISVPEHEVANVQGQDVLLVRRFDRAVSKEGILRHRMVSAATVFQADEAIAKFSFTGSYPRLARELSRWTVTGQNDRQELFRRIAFNCLASVTDDHERNHALVAEGAHFRLSPAFDLVPQPGNTKKRYLALPAGTFGAIAARQNLLSSLDAFQLSHEEANGIIDEVRNVIRGEWRKKFAQREVAKGDLRRVEACFDPPFFESDVSQFTVM